MERPLPGGREANPIANFCLSTILLVSYMLLGVPLVTTVTGPLPWEDEYTWPVAVFGRRVGFPQSSNIGSSWYRKTALPHDFTMAVDHFLPGFTFEMRHKSNFLLPFGIQFEFPYISHILFMRDRRQGE